MVLGLPIPSLGTLLSLPLLSVFVLPSFLSNFSWATSLNLLFFWLTWATVVLSHQPLNIELYGTLAIRVLLYLVPCAVFLVLDAGLPAFSSSIKTHGARALPKRAASPLSLWHYFGVVLVNIFLGVAVQTAADYGLVKIFRVHSALRITFSLPMPLALAKDLTLAYLVRGPSAYYIHRYLLHSSRNSNPVAVQLTRWHKSWQHSLSTTMPFAAAYDHPAVFLLHRFLPVYLPALLFRFHILTYFLFLAVIGLEEAFAYSGYAVLPSTVLLAGVARRTEAHFMVGGGNYGPWGVMDWVHGTTLGQSDVMDDINQEAEKRDVRGKARRAVHRTSDAVRDRLADSDEATSETSAANEAGIARRALRSRK